MWTSSGALYADCGYLMTLMLFWTVHGREVKWCSVVEKKGDASKGKNIFSCDGTLLSPSRTAFWKMAASTREAMHTYGERQETHRWFLMTKMAPSHELCRDYTRYYVMYVFTPVDLMLALLATLVVFLFFLICCCEDQCFNITNEQVQSLLSLFAKSSQGEFDECLQNLFFQCVFFFCSCCCFIIQSVSQPT